MEFSGAHLAVKYVTVGIYEPKLVGNPVSMVLLDVNKNKNNLYYKNRIKV